MIAANEAVAGAARGAQAARAVPRPRAARPAARGAADRPARVARRPDAAAARAHDRRSRRASWSAMPRVDARCAARPRPRGVHVARPALAQAGALLAAQPRPLRPALAALLPLHLADPPLPGPRSATARCWPRSAPARRRCAPRDLEAAGEWCSARERDAMAIERTRRQRRARVPARAASCSSAAGEPRVRRRGHRRDRRGRVRRLRRLRGHAAGAPAARRLVGAQRARDDAGRRRSGERIRLGDPVPVQVEKVDAPRGRVDLLPVELSSDQRVEVRSMQRRPSPR